MDEFSREEYAALRTTISRRGTTRAWLVFAAMAIWSLTLVAVLVWLPNPVAATIPLLILVTGFEANRVLHLGVERIGRYLQVFYEECLQGSEANVSVHAISPPAWERTTMIFGPTVPGAGGHPLYLPLFLLATFVNLLAVVLPGPVVGEVVTLAIPHLAFLVWMLYANRGMTRQRETELARYRRIRDEGLRPS